MNIDVSVFAKYNEIIVIYIDDFFLCDVIRIKINRTKDILKVNFYMSDGELVFFAEKDDNNVRSRILYSSFVPTSMLKMFF